MPKPLLLDIVTFLTNLSVVKGDGIDTFRDFTPEEPDNLVALIEYTGNPAVLYDAAVHRSVQVSCRDKDADAARRKALEVFKAFQDNMDEAAKVAFTDERWGQVYLRQTPYRISTDKSDRVTYAFNIGITTTIE